MQVAKGRKFQGEGRVREVGLRFTCQRTQRGQGDRTGELGVEWKRRGREVKGQGRSHGALWAMARTPGATALSGGGKGLELSFTGSLWALSLGWKLGRGRSLQKEYVYLGPLKGQPGLGLNGIIHAKFY